MNYYKEAKKIINSVNPEAELKKYSILGYIDYVRLLFFIHVLGGLNVKEQSEDTLF